MTETELMNSLEYLSAVFKGLSGKKKDYLLDTARALLEVQDDNSYLADCKTICIWTSKKIKFIRRFSLIF